MNLSGYRCNSRFKSAKYCLLVERKLNSFYPCSFQYFSFASLCSSSYKSHMIEQTSSQSTNWKLHMAKLLLRYFLTKASLIAFATAVLKTPLLAPVDLISVWIILSTPLCSKGLPLFFDLVTLLGDWFWTFTNFGSSWCCFLKVFTGLLLIQWIYAEMNRAFKVSFSLANYPIWNQSVSLYFW